MSKRRKSELRRQVARCKRQWKRILARAHRARLRVLDINGDNNVLKRFAHELFR